MTEDEKEDEKKEEKEEKKNKRPDLSKLEIGCTLEYGADGGTC